MSLHLKLKLTAIVLMAGAIIGKTFLSEAGESKELSAWELSPALFFLFITVLAMGIVLLFVSKRLQLKEEKAAK